ncbi:MAG: histidine phosphatase family protein [Deltaproteobacteria bacterium]|nr:histidine phosphatase family protein [Deltaproteobacteria bacterium]
MIQTGIIPQHAATRISLVRHAGVHNPSNIFYGRMPGFSISKRGRLEATRTARTLKDLTIEEIYSSPLLRCRQTAIEILHYHPHLKLRQSRLITEVLTPFQGKTSEVVDLRAGDVYTGVDSKYEQPEDILLRVQKFLSRTRRTCSGKHVVVVTHGDVIVFMMLWARDFPLTPDYKKRFTTLGILEEYPATSSITTFCYSTDRKDERPSIAYFNPMVHVNKM